jgi:hypothetical protein
VVTEEHTSSIPKKVGSQSSYLLIQQNQAEMQDMKIVYLRQMLTKSTGSTASFKTHGKSNQVLFINNGAPFDISGAHIPHFQWQV